MTLKVIGSGEVVEQVFWLDTRSRTCGVKLRHPETRGERCGEMMLANLEGESNGKKTRAVDKIENALGTQAHVILVDD